MEYVFNIFRSYRQPLPFLLGNPAPRKSRETDRFPKRIFFARPTNFTAERPVNKQNPVFTVISVREYATIHIQSAVNVSVNSQLVREIGKFNVKYVKFCKKDTR